MDPEISKVLDAICLERDNQKYSATFLAASELVVAYGEVGLADKLFNGIPRTVPFEIVSELFDILSWQTNDNGADITRTLERWLLEGLDNRKLLIALHVEVYPFLNEDEMVRVLSDLAQKNHRVAARCKMLIENRSSGARARALPPEV
jgi:hypothetical protein